MKWIAIAAAVLAMAACGEGGGAESETPTCYDVQVTTRVDVSDKTKFRSICTNQTQYEWGCVRGKQGDYSVYSCVYLRGNRAGAMFYSPFDGACYLFAVDNHPCCDAANPGGVEYWNCQ